MKLFEMQRIEGRTAIWLEGSRCFLASNIYRRVSLSRILIHMPGAGWGDTELCCRFQAAEYANTSPCITVFRSYHATGKTYQFHWPHSTLQQVWMLDNVRCVCPYMWVSQNGCPLHVHESFRWIQNCDIIYGIRCTPCTWELLPKLFQIIHNFKQVIHCTETWPDRIMPGSYPLTSNILCLTCFFRSFPYLHACCIYIYIYINIYLPTNQNLGTSEVVGMSALSFGNWCQHIFVNPEDAMQGKVLKSDQRSTGATAETGLQYLS